jgi:FtsP/CotA-like multicopper oxidase with cupredoxin domain
LDASNARFYNITFSNGMPFTLIGSDGGYLKSPVSVTSALFSPAERVDILVDFSKLAPGEKVIMKNSALWNTSSPKFPNQLETIGQIMQFTITSGDGFKPQTLPSQLNPTLSSSFPNLPTPTKTRILTLGEDISVSPAFPMNLYLDGQEWAAPASETPELGSTEDWVLVNTFDSHNIHLHLAQFQIVSRQSFNLTAYWNDWVALNGNPFPLNHTTVNVPSLEPYLIGDPTLSGPSDQGWKDTLIVYGRQVTVIRVRFAQQDGSAYPFDATAGPGYVWHCHILEHEDNAMMRPIILTNPPNTLDSLFPVVIVVVPVLVFALVFVALRRRQSRSEKQPALLVKKS